MGSRCLQFLCTILLLPASVVAVTCPNTTPVKQMSAEQIRDEMNAIQEHRSDIGLYHSEGDKIQLHSHCNFHWENMKSFKRQHDQILDPDWENAKKLARLQAKSKEKYRACFSEELKNHPKIYNHDLVPAKTIDEFEANLNHLSKQFSQCRMAARFADLKFALDKLNLKNSDKKGAKR